MSKFKSFFWGVTAVFIWSALPAFVKVGSTAETLPFLLVCRFFLASLVFLPTLPHLMKKLKLIPLQKWFLLLFILGANYYFQGLAMIDLPVSWYLIIFCLNPILSLLFLGLRIDKRILFSLVLSLVGTLTFVNVSELSKMQNLTPFIYITIGMLTWVTYTVVIKKFQTVFNDIESTAVTQLASLLSCLCIWLFAGSKISHLSSKEMTSMVLLGLLTPLAYFGFNACLRREPKFSVVSQYLEPAFGVLIGLVFFKESLSLEQFFGASLIVFATVSLEGLNANKS